MRCHALIVILGSIVVGAAQVGAQCTTTADASAVQKSARLVTSCNYRKLRSGPAVTCRTAAPPACAGTLVDDAMKLAWGVNDPPTAAVDRRALHDQLGCQRSIGKGVSTFIGKKLRYLIQGLSRADAEEKARRKIDRIPSFNPGTHP